jgi:RNA polymerase sigma factor (sigma-70 family)
MHYATDERERFFNALYDAHYAAVRAYAYRRDRAWADDVVAETFLVAWRRLEQIPGEAQLPWLLGVSRNTLLNLHRGERRRREREHREAAMSIAAGSSHSDEHTEAGPEMIALLERLRPADREVLQLVAWERLDRAAIASSLGCSRANVALRLHRACRRLRALLEESVAPNGAVGDGVGAVHTPLLTQGAHHE